MTIEEANKLIDGELYLFKYEGRTIKRMFKGIRTTKNNFTEYIQTYLNLSTYEPTPTEFLYRIAEVELIGVYQTERNGEML